MGLVKLARDCADSACATSRTATEIQHIVRLSHVEILDSNFTANHPSKGWTPPEVSKLAKKLKEREKEFTLPCTSFTEFVHGYCLCLFSTIFAKCFHYSSLQIDRAAEESLATWLTMNFKSCFASIILKCLSWHGERFSLSNLSYIILVTSC